MSAAAHGEPPYQERWPTGDPSATTLARRRHGWQGGSPTGPTGRPRSGAAATGTGPHCAGTPASRREEELLRLLYQQHAAPLLAFVVRLTAGDRQRAEDIVQETLLRAWRNAHKLGAQGQSSLRPWLVTVARRLTIDEHRSTSARPKETYGQDLDGLTTPDETERVLWQMTVADALQTLSSAHREILLQTYFKGRTVQQAAAALGLPLGTAKSRLYYATRALKVVLEGWGVTG